MLKGNILKRGNFAAIDISNNYLSSDYDRDFLYLCGESENHQNNSNEFTANNNGRKGKTKKVVRFTDLPPEIHEYEDWSSYYTDDELLDSKHINISNSTFFLEDKSNKSENTKSKVGEVDDYMKEEKCEIKANIESSDSRSNSKDELLLPILSRREVYEIEERDMKELEDCVDFACNFKTREVISIDGKYIHKTMKSRNSHSNYDGGDSIDEGYDKNGELQIDVDELNEVHKMPELGDGYSSEDKSYSEKMYSDNYVTLKELSIEVNNILSNKFQEDGNNAYIKHNNLETDLNHIDFQSTAGSLSFS